MAAILSLQGFEILTCYDAQATRKGIMDAWESIIRVSRSNDIVVIYYSGHGGIVEDIANKPSIEKEDGHARQSSRYQFLVPMDFSLPGSPTAGSASSFNGILDVELQDLLRRTTDRTRNVTTIFDCCHSGRMARDPSLAGAVPRNLPKVEYAAVSRNVDLLLKADGNSAKVNLTDEDNPYAVRIAAAGAMETAWEDGDGDQRAGVMTRELARALAEAWIAEGDGNRISWQKILLRVRELVNINFPGQNPLVEGPHTRMPFSLDYEISETNAVVLRPDEQDGILQAGQILAGLQITFLMLFILIGFLVSFLNTYL